MNHPDFDISMVYQKCIKKAKMDRKIKKTYQFRNRTTKIIIQFYPFRFFHLKQFDFSYFLALRFAAQTNETYNDWIAHCHSQ